MVKTTRLFKTPRRRGVFVWRHTLEPFVITEHYGNYPLLGLFFIKLNLGLESGRHCKSLLVIRGPIVYYYKRFGYHCFAGDPHGLGTSDQ